MLFNLEQRQWLEELCMGTMIKMQKCAHKQKIDERTCGGCDDQRCLVSHDVALVRHDCHLNLLGIDQI